MFTGLKPDGTRLGPTRQVHKGIPPHNLRHVRQFLQEEWDRLAQANIRTLVHSMRARVAACIDAVVVPLNTE